MRLEKTTYTLAAATDARREGEGVAFVLGDLGQLSTGICAPRVCS